MSLLKIIKNLFPRNLVIITDKSEPSYGRIGVLKDFSYYTPDYGVRGYNILLVPDMSRITLIDDQENPCKFEKFRNMRKLRNYLEKN